MAILLGTDEILCRVCGKAVRRGDIVTPAMSFESFTRAGGQVVFQPGTFIIHVNCDNPQLMQDPLRPVIGGQPDESKPNEAPVEKPEARGCPCLHLVEEEGGSCPSE